MPYSFVLFNHAVPGTIDSLIIEVQPNGRVDLTCTQPDDGGAPIINVNVTYQLMGIGDCDRNATVSRKRNMCFISYFEIVYYIKGR